MAIRKESSLGGVTGKLGDTITRYRNKKYVVYKIPDTINFSRSEAALSARRRFSHAVKLAKLINSNKELSEIWKFAPVPGTNAYQKLIKYNIGKVNNGGLTSENIISPPGIELYTPKLIFDQDQISFTSVINKKIPLLPVSFFVLLSLRKGEQSELLLLSSGNVSFEENILSGNIKPAEADKSLIEKFDEIIVFAAFSFTKKKLREICYTSTQSFQFSLPQFD